MRFAIKTSPQHTTFKDMLAVWKAADDMPIFESGWTFDHFYPIFSDHTGPCLEGWVTTTALAQATKRLRVGVLVTGNVYRHPAVLANMAASLDVISDGRLELGLGAGWNQQECDALHRHCADIGRDPSEIMTSTHLRLDPSDMDALVKEASAFADAGLDLGIVYLPPPHTPAVLEPLAAALTPFAD